MPVTNGALYPLIKVDSQDTQGNAILFGKVNVDGSPAARDKAEAEARVSSPIKSPAVVMGSPVKPTPTSMPTPTP